MKKNNLELRMYGFVPYNISEIQKGIQFGHGVVEYSNEHFETTKYQTWANYWKTFIILNGGTSTSKSPNSDYLGSMENIQISLQKNKITYSVFNEPDLNYMLSSINFIVDERVFNKEKYPDFITADAELNLQLKAILDNFTIETDIINLLEVYKNTLKENITGFDKWIKTIGGEGNFYLRCLLKNYKLA